MYTCVHAGTYMDNFTHKHVHAYMHAHTWAPAHTNMYIHLHAQTHMKAYTWAHAHTNRGNKNQNDFYVDYAWAGRGPWVLG